MKSRIYPVEEVIYTENSYSFYGNSKKIKSYDGRIYYRHKYNGIVEVLEIDGLNVKYAPCEHLREIEVAK